MKPGKTGKQSAFNTDHKPRKKGFVVARYYVPDRHTEDTARCVPTRPSARICGCGDGIKHVIHRKGLVGARWNVPSNDLLGWPPYWGRTVVRPYTTHRTDSWTRNLMLVIRAHAMRPYTTHGADFWTRRWN